MPALELPIFPLSIVLFPGTPQLLHVFEPRYRQMLADCLEGEEQFGVSFVESGKDEDPEPSPGDVGCCAVIRDSRLLADGRSNVLAVGADRYVLSSYVDRDVPYLVGLVETFDDEPDTGPELAELAARVRAGFAKFAEAIRVLTDQTQEQFEIASDPRHLSFQVAAALDVDPRAKQELLVLRSTRERLERLDRLLKPLNAEITARAEVHQRARSNGKGGRTHDIVKGP